MLCKVFHQIISLFILFFVHLSLLIMKLMDFVFVRVVLLIFVTVAVAFTFDLTVFPLNVPVAVALFVTEPFFTSALVIVYVPVPVTLEPQ